MFCPETWLSFCKAVAYTNCALNSLLVFELDSLKTFYICTLLHIYISYFEACEMVMSTVRHWSVPTSDHKYELALFLPTFVVVSYREYHW